MQEAEHHESMRNSAAGVREIHGDICTGGASLDAGLHKVTQQIEFSGCQFPPAEESNIGSEKEAVEINGDQSVSLPLSLSLVTNTIRDKDTKSYIYVYTYTHTHVYRHTHLCTYKCTC